MKELIKNMLADIAKYEDNNLKENIRIRLDKNLNEYLLNIDNSYNFIIDNIEDKRAIKELMK